MNNKWVHRLLPLSIVLFGVWILTQRLMDLIDNCEALCWMDQKLVLRHEFFESEVVFRYPRIRETPLHLVVFLDPESDCTVCLLEMQEWVEPLGYSSHFGVTLVLPKNTDPDIVHGMLSTHRLTFEVVQRFEPSSPVGRFHRFGVLKVFYTVEHGVEWYELGSKTEESYRDFAIRIAARIQAFESP